jgi:hypothetical protein
MRKLLIIVAAAAFGLASTPTEAQFKPKKGVEAAAKAKTEADKKGKSAQDKKRKRRAETKRDGR